MTATATAVRMCSQKHVFYGVPCSREAKFVLHRHGTAQDICENAAKRIFELGKTRCMDCKQAIWKHWDTEPIK